MSTLAQQNPVQQIPDPDVIRDRLAELAGERELLRKLLKVSLRKQQSIAQHAQKCGELANA